MPRIRYQNINIGGSRLASIDRVNRIIREYDAKGYKLTLRQVYYQFVARGWIENKQTEYKRLGDIINDGRMAGLVDWHAIEDRTRELDGNSHWRNPADIIQAVGRAYAIDKWADQTYRPEVWVEKDALEGVVGSASKDLDIDFFSCRGYTSQTSMWDHSQRMKEYIKNGQRPIILHFGDFDPSGLDMTRDIKERLNSFIVQDWRNEEMADVKGAIKYRDILDDMEERCGQGGIIVERLALTKAQIELYSPPPNPAKTTDARFKKFQEEHGDESWELDALDPDVIDTLIRERVEQLREQDKMDAKLDQEAVEKSLLQKNASQWSKVAKFLGKL